MTGLEVPLLAAAAAVLGAMVVVTRRRADRRLLAAHPNGCGEMHCLYCCTCTPCVDDRARWVR